MYFKQTLKWLIFNIHIYIYVCTWYIYNISLLHLRKHQPCDAFHVLAGRMVLRMGHYTCAFTLVAIWENSPEWHIFLAFLYVSDYFEHFWYINIFLLWDTRYSDIYVIYVTQETIFYSISAGFRPVWTPFVKKGLWYPRWRAIYMRYMPLQRHIHENLGTMCNNGFANITVTS